ncbi:MULTISPECIES: CTB family bacteriocin [Chroococcidiopsis]|jgi:hypothetical protein|uniref:Uncharacterized protein n=1 Tax=Chroococcidiopsis thermalis (strain PCC 7203) TaxID=251229 RepID=K9U2F5_CHRTP|nr:MULTISPECIES: CTB family bacteriocin [Chroococcidiopsis]AFY88788.1 hypothetical protein Chro_3328 [Chroococcidiopsis thermalis PCC 7203]MBE9015116.1 CTB family bacteriocin [Chroococcidiopsidales cyanobacterium LEGE 13417]PSM50288.1 hypothetical protein C7Y66_04540 [Chroococcidiopsis sp. CCALA 051]
MFFSKNQSSELFLDLSEEQQETVAGGKVYENNKQYYIKTETSDGGSTDSDSQKGKRDKPVIIEPIAWQSPFGVGEQLMFPKMII